MFAYTIAAFNKTVKDIKRVALAFNLFTIVCYIAYLVYALIADIGNTYANAALCALSVSYFIYYLFSVAKIVSSDDISKVKRTYKFLKLTVNAITLSIAVYGVFLNYDENKSAWITFLLCAIWVLQLVLEIASIILEDRLNFFKTALTHDLTGIVKFINVFKSDDIELPKEDEDQLSKLSALVVLEKKAKKQRIATKRQAKIQSFKDKVGAVFVKK